MTNVSDGRFLYVAATDAAITHPASSSLYLILYAIYTILAARSADKRFLFGECMNECLLNDRSTAALVGGNARILPATFNNSVEQQIPIHQEVAEVSVDAFQMKDFENNLVFDWKSAMSLRNFLSLMLGSDSAMLSMSSMASTLNWK